MCQTKVRKDDKDLRELTCITNQWEENRPNNIDCQLSICEFVVACAEGQGQTPTGFDVDAETIMEFQAGITRDKKQIFSEIFLGDRQIHMMKDSDQRLTLSNQVQLWNVCRQVYIGHPDFDF